MPVDATPETPGWIARLWPLPGILLCCLISALVPVLAAPAGTASGEASLTIRTVSARADGDNVIIQPELTIGLTDATVEAIISGIPIALRVSTELKRERMLLWDESVTSTTDYIQISYHALSRRFLLHQTQTDTYRIYRHLDQTLGALDMPEPIRLLVDEPLQADQRYYGTLRIELDVGRLPRPLQLPAYLSSDWRLDSGHRIWRLER